MRAESGEKRANTANTKSAPLRIVDQNGRPAVSGVPSATSQIVDVTVGPGISRFTRTQSNFRRRHGAVDLGRQRPQRHQWSSLRRPIRSFVRLTTRAVSRGLFPTPALFISIHLHTPGSYSYICIAHCVIGMTGVVNVSGGCAPVGLVSGSAPADSGCPNGWRLFPGQREVLRHGRSRLRHSWQRVHSSV